MGRILVIRGGAIGDFLVTLPLLAALRARLPGNRIEVLGYPHIADLARAHGLVEAVHPIDSRPLAGFFAARSVLDPALSAFFSGFHLIISHLYDPDLIFQSNIASVSKAQFLQGLHRPDETTGRHATEQLLDVLQRLAIFDADPVPRLAAPRQQPGQQDVLAVHPGSGSPRKNWPEERWATLLEQVIDGSEASVLLVGGEAEEGRLERLAARLPLERREILRSQPLVTVAERLRGCRGFIGHDSGITHLAAALGLPGIALWGPSRAQVWSPRGGDIRLVQAQPDLESLEVPFVHQALVGHLPWLASGT
jgi:ADP-heptose:LPS heptosyltransferase